MLIVRGKNSITRFIKNIFRELKFMFKQDASPYTINLMVLIWFLMLQNLLKGKFFFYTNYQIPHLLPKYTVKNMFIQMSQVLLQVSLCSFLKVNLNYFINTIFCVYIINICKLNFFFLILKYTHEFFKKVCLILIFLKQPKIKLKSLNVFPDSNYNNS